MNDEANTGMHTHMRGVIKILFGLFLVSLIVFVGVKIRETIIATRYIGVAEQLAPNISVSATGKGYVTPNVATVDLGATSRAATANAAQDANTKIMNALTDAMKALAIEAKDLRTSSYDIQPVYDYFGGTSRIVAYEASQTLTVKIRNSDLVGTVLGKAGDLGATNIGSVQFTADDDTAAQTAARQEAIANARAQAEAIAESMEVELGRVVSYSEGQSNVPYSGGFGGGMMSAEAKAVPNVEPGQNEVDMTVSMTFEIK